MPVHDWTRVALGVFHDFHHAWIEEIKRALNAGLLPDDYYALAEQFAGGIGPDVLTLQERTPDDHSPNDPPRRAGPARNGATIVLDPPRRVTLTAETEMEFYRRKQKAVVVRHISDD
jgi:hypothetical protein